MGTSLLYHGHIYNTTSLIFSFVSLTYYTMKKSLYLPIFLIILFVAFFPSSSHAQVVDSHGRTMDSDGFGGTYPVGFRFQALNSVTLDYVNEDPLGDCDTMVLRDDSNNLLDTATIVSHVATFDYDLVASTNYRIGVKNADNSDCTYRYGSGGPSYPVTGTNIEWISSLEGTGTDTTYTRGIVSMTTDSPPPEPPAGGVIWSVGDFDTFDTVFTPQIVITAPYIDGYLTSFQVSMRIYDPIDPVRSFVLYKETATDVFTRQDCQTPAQLASLWGASEATYGSLVTVSGFSGEGCLIEVGTRYTIKAHDEEDADTSSDLGFAGTTANGAGSVVVYDFDYTSVSSRLVSVASPLDGSNQASTTVTFSGVYYVSSADINGNEENVFVDIYISNSESNSTTTLNDNYYIRLPVDTFDELVNYSTTTVLLIDSRYTWRASLERGDMTLVHSNQFRMPGGLRFFQFTTGNFDPTYGLNYDVSSCNLIAFSGFDIQDCFYNLIFPNNVVFETAVLKMKDVYFRAAPLGYATRFVEILTETSTTSMPTLTYTSSETSMFGSRTFSFDPFGTLASADSPINYVSDNDENPKTVWQIMESPIKILVYLTLIFMIVGDITGIVYRPHHVKSNQQANN